ncbi:MAG TPA: ester cyclase [Polyangiaceae bacterium]
MTKTILTTVALLVLAGCQQQEPAASPAPPPAEPAPIAPSPPPVAAAPAPPPPPATPAERAQGFQSCWAAFNAKDWAKFGACYAEGASTEQVDTGFPAVKGRSDIVEKSAKSFAAAMPDITGEIQLTLVNGSNIVSIVLLKGTHTGPLPTPDGSSIPATNKKIGILTAHAVDLTEDGRAVQYDRFYTDGSSEMGQLGLNSSPHRKLIETSWAEKPVVIAGNTDAEKMGIAAAAKVVENFNKHDVKALIEPLADDVVWSEMSAPADKVGKAAVKRSYEELFKGFPDAKLEVTRTWAAGDYVVSEGALVGTNTGDMPSMKLKKTGKSVRARFLEVDKISGGKVKNVWIFDNGASFASQLGLLKPPAQKPAPATAKPAPVAAAPAAAPGKPGAAPAAAPASTPAAKPATAPVAAAPAAAAPKAAPAAPAAPAPAAPAQKPAAAPAAPASPAPAMTAPKK